MNRLRAVASFARDTVLFAVGAILTVAGAIWWMIRALLTDPADDDIYPWDDGE